MLPMRASVTDIGYYDFHTACLSRIGIFTEVANCHIALVNPINPISYKLAPSKVSKYYKTGTAAVSK